MSFKVQREGTHININCGRARWLTPIIPELREAEAGGSRGQEIDTILVNKVKPRLTKNTKISWAWWCLPVIPATREAEAGELLEPRRQVSVSRYRAIALQSG